MTALLKHIQEDIRLNGPMDMARYMSLCLGHPEHGYYMTRDPFGVEGDFITAPEVSQVFGELIGAWTLDGWMKASAPDPVHLVELGPGRGTLLGDLLRITKGANGFHEALHIHLVESSLCLKNVQSQAFRNYAPAWHSDLKTLPDDAPLIVIGNEFLDALPVHQLVKTQNGWNEVVIGLSEEGHLALGQKEADPAIMKHIPQSLLEYKEGDMVEVSPVLKNYLNDLFEHIQKQIGFCLFIDYGYTGFTPQKTLQAVQKHQHVSILHDPGECDLTAHVCFDTVSSLALEKGLSVHGPISQKSFLENLGIRLRIEMLSKNATPGQKKGLEAAYERLCGIDQMGELFKVIAVSSDPSLELEGFICA